MHCTNIQFTVKSRKQADELCAICGMFYTTARVSSVGYIGGHFHEAPAIITCTYEDRHHGKLAWEKLVTALHKKGYSDCIY